MKRYNRINLKFVFLGIVVPIILFAISFGGVFAYFTAKTKNVASNLTIGVIKVSMSDTLTTSIVSSKEESVKLANILPGTNVVVSGQVKNIGNSKFYAILVVTTATKFAGQADYTTTSTKLYTAEGAPIEGVAGAYTTASTEVDAGNSVNFTFNFPFEFGLEDEYQGADLKITVYARAIQFENISSAVNATNLLADLQ